MISLSKNLGKLNQELERVR